MSTTQSPAAPPAGTQPSATIGPDRGQLAARHRPKSHILRLLPVLILVAMLAVGCGAASERPPQETLPADAPIDHEFAGVIVDGLPEGGVQVWEATVGDVVSISVSADVSEELHLHGYDLYADITPDEPGIIRFTADMHGVFEVETHDTDTLVAMLQVSPA